jgi:hypothetical protein
MLSAQWLKLDSLVSAAQRTEQTVDVSRSGGFEVNAPPMHSPTHQLNGPHPLAVAYFRRNVNYL